MTHEELHHQIAQMSEEREQLAKQIVNLTQQLKVEHDELAKELGMAGNFIGQIQLLKRRLVETERAGEDIRKKNGDLVELNRELRADILRLKSAPVGKEGSVDRLVISEKTGNWQQVSQKYQDLLELARKHGIAVLVLP